MIFLMILTGNSFTKISDNNILLFDTTEVTARNDEHFKENSNLSFYWRRRDVFEQHQRGAAGGVGG